MFCKKVFAVGVSLWIAGFILLSLPFWGVVEFTRLTIFGPLAVHSLGLAVIGYVLALCPEKLESSKWLSPHRKIFKWLGYSDKQVEEDSLLFPWSPKSQLFGRKVARIAGIIFSVLGTLWFIGFTAGLLGFDFGLDPW